MTMDISVYSFTAIAQRAEKLMTDGGSMLTLTYYGAEKVLPHYNVMGVAKAALEASVKYMAMDLGPKNIRVNCICSAVVDTDMTKELWLKNEKKRKDAAAEHPLGRIGKTNDIANAALYFASNDSSWTTGAILAVDGGVSVK